MAPKIVAAKRINLRDVQGCSEKTIEDAVRADPSILGLGTLTFVRQQYAQEHGVLDLLLEDEDQTQRFEVELMLGKTDESHIIRVIEYWDIERRRYPGYEHIAVLVAEDVTSRFLGLLSIFSGTIPLVVIQMHATMIGDQVNLSFIKVLDQRALRVDEAPEPPGPKVDRSDWLAKSSTEIMALMDKALEVVNRTAPAPFALNYKSQYVGLKSENESWGATFVHFRPKKAYMDLLVNVDEDQVWIDRLSAAGLTANAVAGRTYFKVHVSPAEWEKHKALLTELIDTAVNDNK